MRMTLKQIVAKGVALFSLVFSCGGAPEPDPVPAGPAAPRVIFLGASSFELAQEGGTVTLDITAPARPEVSALPSWIQFTPGTYDAAGYVMKGAALTVAANDSYKVREAEPAVSCVGADAVSFKVSQAAKQTEPDPAPGDNEAWQLAMRLGLGWNMGNHFDAYYSGSWSGDREGYPDETAWGGARATQTTFNGVKAAGFTTVRIPVSWLKMIGPAPAYTIEKTWMDRVYEVVQFAHNAGLTVIVNTHHDENHGVDNTYQWLDIKHAVDDPALDAQIREKIHAVWTQIAERFNDCGDWLILESFNEINDGRWGWSEDFLKDPTRQCDILNAWNQVFVDAVRATGGNNATRWLGVPGYAANPEYLKYFTLPDDPAGKTMVAFHCYDPFDFTLRTEDDKGNPWIPPADWGHTGKSFPKGEEQINTLFSSLCADYVDKNIPVYMGEFGCSMRSKTNGNAWAYYLYYLEYVVKAAKVNGIPCYLWDNGAEGAGQEHHGYIHHGTGDYVGTAQEPVERMVKAWFTDSPSYTLHSIYVNAPEP